MHKIILVALLLWTLPFFVSAAEPALAQPLTVQEQGEPTQISFGLSAPTDIEVVVLDSKGQTVRHLAAGVLGGAKAPPPPLQQGLAQKLTWDGKNDFGQSAQGAP